MNRLRVMLAEDHPLIREVIQRLLALEYDVVETVERGDELLPAALRARPEVVVLDISLPGLSGLQALPSLRAQLPETCLIVLTVHNSPFYRQEAFQRGADGYVVKGRAFTDLLPALAGALADKGRCAKRQA